MTTMGPGVRLNLGFITCLLVILVNFDLDSPHLIFLIFKVELIGIAGEINEIMHIKRLAVGMAHGKHLVIIGDHLPEIVEVKP